MRTHSAIIPRTWDIFCKVIDNYGDVGVCWRLAVNLAQRHQTVRLWVDDPHALTWMAPKGADGVELMRWTTPIDNTLVRRGDVLIEAFGCDLDAEFIAAYLTKSGVESPPFHWINLEYLTAETFAQHCHGLPSPVMSGPGKGLTKHFFYPGFVPDTGGLIREPDLLQRQARFDRAVWLETQGVTLPTQRVVSLFCYEPQGLDAFLSALAADQQPTMLLVTAGRAAEACHLQVSNKNSLDPTWNKGRKLSFLYLDKLDQRAFDHLLWASDFNCVRGEDSLVRALWAGKPFVWHIYPQDDGAHRQKLDAFLDWMQAPASLRTFHYVWNGFASVQRQQPEQAIAALVDFDLWQQCFIELRKRLLSQPELTDQLIQFVSKAPKIAGFAA